MQLGTLNFGNVGTAYLVYQVPAGKQASFSVNVSNRHAASDSNGGIVKVRLALTSGGAPAPGGDDWIEYDVAIGPNSAFERTGLILGAGEALFAQTDTLGVAVKAYGFEEFTAVSIGANAVATNAGVTTSDFDINVGLAGLPTAAPGQAGKGWLDDGVVRVTE